MYGDLRESEPIWQKMTLADRFWSKVNKLPGEDACWLWTGGAYDGYGQLSVDGKPVKATHVAWFLATGKWPEKQMLHKCDNPPCCRYEHLFEGTQLENIEDMIRKGRAATHVGERNPKAKLTDEQVLEIRARVAAGAVQAHVALQFGITKTHVGYLVKRKQRTDI